MDKNSANLSTDLKVVDVNQLSKSEIWQNVGFHRQLSGFFYNIPILLMSIVLSVVIAGTFFQYLYPFAESLGYKSTVAGIFVLMFQIFDLGTANVINRFIGEYAIKDQQRMVKYIQYFIWYQMMTGLLQTTLISVYALFIVPEGDLAYTVWIMLLISTTQYPGMLGVFKGTLEGLQQFTKKQLVDFISTDIFERFTELGLILLGRAWGRSNPMIGELFGVAIFASIARYLDDFLATALSAKLFDDILKQYNMRVWQCFVPNFDRKIVKECFLWGLKSGLPSLLTPVVSLIELALWLQFIPQYATFLSLAAIARNFSSLVSQKIRLGGGIAEAYLNGKENLTKYYVSQSMRYSALFQGMIIPIVFASVLILEPILMDVVKVPYFLGMIGFIFPQAILSFFKPYIDLSGDVIYGSGNVNLIVLGRVIEAIVSTASLYIVLAVFHFQDLGLAAIPYVLYLSKFPGSLCKAVLYYIYIERKVFHIQVPWKQGFGVTILSSLIYIGIVWGLYHVLFVPLQAATSTLIAIIPFGLVGVILFPFILYFPLTAWLGGWDDDALEVLQKAKRISGAGKFLISPIYAVIKKVSSKSKYHNKFKIDETLAVKEARELMELRNSKAITKVKIMK